MQVKRCRSAEGVRMIPRPPRQAVFWFSFMMVMLGVRILLSFRWEWLWKGRKYTTRQKFCWALVFIILGLVAGLFWGSLKSEI